MKKFIKEITKSMQGSFLPKEERKDKIVRNINNSLNRLDYYGPSWDKKSIKKDLSAFNKDFNKAVKEAKIKFDPIL